VAVDHWLRLSERSLQSARDQALDIDFFILKIVLPSVLDLTRGK
jgi:hypothetical protein